MSKHILEEAKVAEVLRANMAEILADDEVALLDMVEGETNLFESIDEAIAIHNECKALEEAIATQVSELQARKKRFCNRREMLKSAIASAMGMIDARKLERPGATLSIKAVPSKVEVIEEADIPPQFWKRSDPTLDKRALLEALKDGDVPGAALSNGGETIQIRSA